MSEKQSEVQEKKIYFEARGQYNWLDSKKIYSFQFPIANSIEDNLAAVSFLRNELLTAIAEKEKKAEEASVQAEDQKDS